MAGGRSDFVASARTRSHRPGIPRGLRWPNDLDKPEPRHRVFGPAQLIWLMVVLLALVVLTISVKGENHGRYSGGETDASSVIAP